MREVDPELIAIAQEFVWPGAVVWDIGANLGLFSFAAAQLAGPKGKVTTFEPDIWLVEGLRQSARRQPPTSASVEVVPVAVACENGLRRFAIAERARASNHLEGYGLSETGGAAETCTVPAFTIDWLIKSLPVPDVIKIDVEGAEREVLAGAVELFAQARPMVICEVGVEARDWITEFFHSRNYILYSGLVAKNERQPCTKASWFTLAVPSKIS
jgi:FkbM family methyltransferase